MLRHRRFLALFALVGTGALLGCSSERATVTDAPPELSVTATPSLVAGAAARFHAQNPMDWVGREHTRLVHGYLRRMLSRHNFHGDVCADMLDYVGKHAGGPSTESRNPAEVRLPAAAALASGFCAKSAAVRQTLMSTAIPSGSSRPGPAEARYVVAPPVPTDTGVPVSSDATALVAQISTDVGIATNADYLASLLSPIVSTADTLSQGDDAEIVESVASVAQSSYEDWTEGEADSADASVTSDYGSCYQNSTVGEQDTFDHCIGPQLEQPTMFQPARVDSVITNSPLR